MSLLTNNLKKLIINADDFAQSEAIDAAIIDLAERKVISSTSALVLSPRWEQSAKELTNLPIQVGLHLDLTSHFTDQYGCHYKLSELIYSAYTRQLNVQHLEKIIEFQWDRFTEICGRSPDFIDGHQHVHQLPVVRDVLFSIITKKGWGSQQNHWLRVCHSQHWRGYKAMIISILGAKYFQQKANKMGMRTNSDFAGVYSFDEHSNLKKLWENWLKELRGKTPVMMCHVAMPGQSNPQNDADEANDPIYSARVNEYQWLASESFQLLLNSKGFS